MKEKVYVGQTKLRIQVTCDQDVTSATDMEIRYCKPDGTTGAWDASTTDAENGVLYYDVTSATDLNQAGIWSMWAWVSFYDGRSAPGDIIKFKVYEEGS